MRVKELKPETIAELKKLRFEVLTEMKSANAVVGRIAVEKIAALAEFDQVTFISPQNRQSANREKLTGMRRISRDNL